MVSGQMRQIVLYIGFGERRRMAEFATTSFDIMDEPKVAGDISFLSVVGITELPDPSSNYCFEFDGLLLKLRYCWIVLLFLNVLLASYEIEA